MRKRTDVLEELVLEMYARGLSTRDVEDALKEIGDGQLLLSRSSVSRISDALWEEYEAFAQRELGGYDIVYLFADAIYESLREQGGLKDVCDTPERGHVFGEMGAAPVVSGG